MNERILLRASLVMILSFAGFALMACKGGGNIQPGSRTAEGSPQSNAPASTAPPADGVRRITTAELKDALEKGSAIAVDVRGSVEYDLGHIKGARSLPLGLIAQQAGDLPRDKMIVTYCA